MMGATPTLERTREPGVFAVGQQKLADIEARKLRQPGTQRVHSYARTWRFN